MRKILAAVFVAVSGFAQSQELCTSSPCTANGGTEFSATAAANGSKGQVEIDGALAPNGTGNPTGLRMIWNSTGTGTGAPQGVVNYMYGYSGSSPSILNYFQNDSVSTNASWLFGNSAVQGGSFGSTVGHNYGAIYQTFGSSTLNASVVGLAFGSSAAGFNAGGTFLATNGGGGITALYAGSHSTKPNYAPAVVQINSASTGPVPPLVVQVDGATVLQVRRDKALQLVDQGTRPTCDAAHRGALWYEAGAAGAADTLEACGKDQFDAYVWKPIAIF